MPTLIRDIRDEWLVDYRVPGGIEPTVTLRLNRCRGKKFADIWLRLTRVGSFSAEEAEELADALERAAFAVRAAGHDAREYLRCDRPCFTVPGDDGG